ncbi:hypothetical protein [Clostridium sp.]|uniref:hypothetical protein n=1 Tax=Clostridium sp. TaxID=1506 RepID=UPI002618D2D6|nr:hypothetical protein [Clostridium sp.]
MSLNIEVVARGTWVYGGSVVCKLRIVKSDMMYGSGDYEDESELRDDKKVECYHIEYESMNEKGVFNSRSTGFLTLSEAMKNAEEVTNPQISWDI